MFSAITTVREVVARYPQSLSVFERHGIDYCCGAGERLHAAAIRQGIDLSRLIEELEEAIARPPQPGEQGRDWSSASLAELADHILHRHHTYMRTELPRLAGIMGTVARVHGPNHGDVLLPLAARYQALKQTLEAHLDAEERIVFPLIKQGPSNGELRSRVEALKAEHEEAGETLAEMRRLTTDHALPEDACATFGMLYQGLEGMESDLHRHIHLENNILFPRATGEG